MKVLRNIVSIMVLAVLIGCERHNDATENASLPSDIGKVQSQSNSEENQVTVTNALDSKSVVHFSSVTNQQPQEIWTSEGFGFEDITLTNIPVVDVDTNSLP